MLGARVRALGANPCLLAGDCEDGHLKSPLFLKCLGEIEGAMEYIEGLGSNFSYSWHLGRSREALRSLTGTWTGGTEPFLYFLT